MSEEKKFEGAIFNSKFYLSREALDSGIGRETKKEMFQRIVSAALNRVKYDLVEEMMLINSEKDRWPPFVPVSDEQIDKFVKHGIKITIIGEIREEVEGRELKGFEAYAKHLRELHEMFKEARDETEEGDAIREKMLDIWYSLNESDQNKGRELSVALKTGQSTP